MPVLTRHIPALTTLFSALGNKTRLQVIVELQKGPRNVTALVKKLKMPQPTVSHHLSLLRQARLVTTKRKGKEVFYSLNEVRPRTAKALRTIGEKPGGMKIGSLVFGTVK